MTLKHCSPMCPAGSRLVSHSGSTAPSARMQINWRGRAAETSSAWTIFLVGRGIFYSRCQNLTQTEEKTTHWRSFT